MMITKMLLTPNNYSRPQIPLKRVAKIAVHYVGNAGSSAEGNRDYFESLKDGKHGYASSHYIVGLKGEIIQCVPENEWAYCTNEANAYSISIENCHPKDDGKFTEKTYASLVELCADLCKRYGLDPMKDIIRHYDVTGKLCPLYWVNHPQDFAAFKQEVKDFIEKVIINNEDDSYTEIEQSQNQKGKEKLAIKIDDSNKKAQEVISIQKVEIPRESKNYETSTAKKNFYPCTNSIIKKTN